MTQQVVQGEQLVRAFAIQAWREAEPGALFDQVLELTRARYTADNWMAKDVFIDAFGLDMLRHVKTTERPEC